MKKIFDKKGMVHAKTAAVIIIIAMIFSVILTYVSMMSVVSRARDDTQRVLDSFCIEKSVVIYGSIKNGNKQMSSGVYTTEFMNKIVSDLGLARSGNNGYHSNGSDIIFRYNNPLTANLTSDTLTLTTEFEVVMPVTFAGKKITDMKVPLKVTSMFVLK